MAVVARLQFSDLPAGSASLACKGLEKWPGGISFCNTGNESGWNAGFAIGWKMQRFFKATQTKIAQSRSHKLTRLAGLQSPKIEMALPARQPPAISVFSGDVAKVGANFRRKQVQHALSIVGNERVEENQSLHTIGVGLDHAADDHARITVADEDHPVRDFCQRKRNVRDMLLYRNVRR